MAIALVLGFLFSILGVVGIALFFVLRYRYNNDYSGVGAYAGSWVSLSLGIIFIILTFFIPGSFRTVDTGEVAVVKHLGEIRDVRTAGTYFDFWITEKYEKYDAKVQTLDIVDSAYSKDAQTMDIQMTVQYQIDSSKIKEIAINYGGLSSLADRIRSVAIEKTKGVLSSHRAMNDSNDPDSPNGIIENREAVGKEVTEAVTAALNGYYITVNTVALTNIDFSDAFEKTVEDKMIAEQEKLKAEYEKEKKEIEAKAAAEVARIQAEAQVLVAKAEAEAKIEAAKGDADAQKTIAQAEAYATQIKIIEVARSLGYEVNETTDSENNTVYEVVWKDDAGKQVILTYLQYLEYLSKWNGELPEVIAGDSTSIFIPSGAGA